MKFKVGDKVKFLNEAGGGIVSKIISNSMVNVAVEDGFDIPTMTSELVLIESAGHVSDMFKEDYKVHLEKSAPAPIPKYETGSANQTAPGFTKNISKAKEEAGVYLALVPTDQKWLITGDLDIYLVNHTSYDILYSLFLKTGNKFTGYDYSSVEPESSILLETISREGVDDWREGVVQILYHADNLNKILLPAHTNFKVKQNKLNNENSYLESGLITGKAFIISLNLIEQQEKAQSYIGKDEDEIKEQKSVEQKKEALIDRHQTLPKIAEVDLHIGELLDNIAGLESRDMLAVQLKYFRSCLDSAIEQNYKKVTFIHGVGNGVLKNRIIQILKDYEELENHSASIAKYGVGAIDVLIKPWE